MKELHKLYSGKVKIYFDDERHIFTKESGERISGTTSITGLLDKSGALMGWVAKMMGLYLLEEAKKGNDKITERLVTSAKNEYRRLKQEAADIGKMIHDFAERWIKEKRKPEIPNDEKVRNGAIAFLSWVKEVGIKFNSSEKIIYSKKYNYAGIMDADGKIGKKRCIIDFKSSSGIYNEMRYQLAGYWNAREEEIGKKYDIGYIIQFNKETGDFKVLEIMREEYLRDRKAFLGLLDTKRREDELSRSTK